MLQLSVLQPNLVSHLSLSQPLSFLTVPLKNCLRTPASEFHFPFKMIRHVSFSFCWSLHPSPPSCLHLLRRDKISNPNLYVGILTNRLNIASLSFELAKRSVVATFPTLCNIPIVGWWNTNSPAPLATFLTPSSVLFSWGPCPLHVLTKHCVFIRCDKTLARAL